MKMQRVTSPHLKEPAPGTWSNCRVYGNQVFVAGMTASSGTGGVLGDGSMYSQAKETFTKIKHLMEAAGGDDERHHPCGHLRDRHQAARGRLEGAPRVLHRRFPDLHAGGGARARHAPAARRGQRHRVPRRQSAAEPEHADRQAGHRDGGRARHRRRHRARAGRAGGARRHPRPRSGRGREDGRGLAGAGHRARLRRRGRARGGGGRPDRRRALRRARHRREQRRRRPRPRRSERAPTRHPRAGQHVGGGVGRLPVAESPYDVRDHESGAAPSARRAAAARSSTSPRSRAWWARRGSRPTPRPRPA